ncbi:MAG: tetraacyldisaccharide 4'-kinase [Henriciella sp.]
MREPRFWAADLDPWSRESAPLLRALLTPVAFIYERVTAGRIRRTKPKKLPAFVICVGNLTAGGVGKSPVVKTLRARIMADTGRRVASLSRGYGGRLKGPVKVDVAQHTAQDVGDEPLMLAASGETWVGRDRAAAGDAMIADGVEIIIMDDGHQNPAIAKDFSIIVIDAATGFGNGYVIPKGPLRERPEQGLARADMIVQMGEGPLPEAAKSSRLPISRGHIKPAEDVGDGRYVAFAGIGRPEKFFETLKGLEVDVADTVPFPDHHVYSEDDLAYLRRLAVDYQARLITTEKDFVRLSEAQRTDMCYLPIFVDFDDERLIEMIISRMQDQS